MINTQNVNAKSHKLYELLYFSLDLDNSYNLTDLTHILVK